MNRKYSNIRKNSGEEIVQFVDQYLTCSTDNKETANLVNLQTFKTCRKKGNPVCRFGFPLPPLPRTMLLYPLVQDVEKYKKKYKEFQKVMNEYKDTVDMTFEEFLEKVAKMSACLVFNPIKVNNFASLFNCTPVGRASDSMMAPT